ncbi:MAG: hypothetical protein ACOXZI_03115 [Candidatus Cryptobacteroides sp.]|jgi:hypothetical protein
MKTLRLLALRAMMSVTTLVVVLSCAKEPMENLKPSSPEKETVTLRLSAPETKTALKNDKTVVWTNGDKLVINSMLYEIKVDADDPSKATVEDVTKADEYFAFYVPCTTNSSTGEVNPQYWYYQDQGVYYHHFDILDTQIWYSGTFSQYANPMAAYSTDGNLHFYNIGSVVKVGLTGNGEKLSRVRLLSNGGKNLAGMMMLTDEQVRTGDLSGMKLNENYYGLLPTVSIFCESNNVTLSSTPTWFYFVTAPFEDESGISFTAEDVDGNVFVRTKTDAFSIGRSEIKEMDPLNYKASAPLKLTAAESAPTSFSVDAVCDDVMSVRYLAIASAAWDSYMNSPSSSWTEQSLASAFINTYDYQTKSEKSFKMEFTKAYNSTGNAVPIAASTSYKVIAQYILGSTGMGKCTILDVTTAAPTGVAPTLDVSFQSVTYNRLSALLKSNDAAGISLWLFTKARYEELVSSGKSDSEIMKEYGKSLTDEHMASAHAAGCLWSWGNLSQGTDYVLLVVAASSTGMETIVKEEIATEWYLFNPNTTVLETVSTEATFSTNMFSIFNVNPLTITPVVLKKLPGMDVFVIENLFKGNTALAELGFIEEKGTYLTIIDARDKNAVDIRFDVNKLGIYNSMYLGFNYDLSFGCYATYNTNASQEEYPLGTYDSENNAISIVSLILGNPNRIYGGMSSCTLTWPLPTNSVTVENFSKTQAGW